MGTLRFCSEKTCNDNFFIGEQTDLSKNVFKLKSLIRQMLKEMYIKLKFMENWFLSEEDKLNLTERIRELKLPKHDLFWIEILRIYSRNDENWKILSEQTKFMITQKNNKRNIPDFVTV